MHPFFPFKNLFDLKNAMSKFFCFLLRRAASLNVSGAARFAQAAPLTSLPRSGMLREFVPRREAARPTLPPLDHGQPSGWTLCF
jgi:hypothetical protein